MPFKLNATTVNAVSRLPAPNVNSPFLSIDFHGETCQARLLTSHWMDEQNELLWLETP